ncbi:MAG: hypothetical protein M2R45_03101 [Verrucomicrobia subdivision 3 bacterium]|nr:hypothetical protein [Limisphaerales bacterium]MCS1413169.1 hypothetical protein [Limisphaerales bacterium]
MGGQAESEQLIRVDLFRSFGRVSDLDFFEGVMVSLSGLRKLSALLTGSCRSALVSNARAVAGCALSPNKARVAVMTRRGSVPKTATKTKGRIALVDHDNNRPKGESQRSRVDIEVKKLLKNIRWQMDASSELSFVRSSEWDSGREDSFMGRDLEIGEDGMMPQYGISAKTSSLRSRRLGGISSVSKS